ncbi:MAG: hypothetical protein AAGJ54_03615 [Planctomycetota bacterium]
MSQGQDKSFLDSVLESHQKADQVSKMASDTIGGTIRFLTAVWLLTTTTYLMSVDVIFRTRLGLRYVSPGWLLLGYLGLGVFAWCYLEFGPQQPMGLSFFAYALLYLARGVQQLLAAERRFRRGELRHSRSNGDSLVELLPFRIPGGYWMVESVAQPLLLLVVAGVLAVLGEGFALYFVIGAGLQIVRTVATYSELRTTLLNAIDQTIEAGAKAESFTEVKPDRSNATHKGHPVVRVPKRWQVGKGVEG